MTHDQPIDPSATLFDELQELLKASGTNKNEQAVNLISACIGEGIDTQPQIIAVLQHLLKRGHVGSILNKSTGPNPQRHKWHLHEDGRYTLHQSQSAS